ncbi:hypothetical protein GW17_00039079 [Ensete ventricosum]|nr:hypothetical protein GW17_00039079 [Ensete ventricosum]
MPLLPLSSTLLLLLAILSSSSSAAGERDGPASGTSRFREAPLFYNAPSCPAPLPAGPDSACSPDALVHVAMTLDVTYLRGSMAAVLSVLQHTDCPQSIFFHFVATSAAGYLSATVAGSFPSLAFQIHPFADEPSVAGLISISGRRACYFNTGVMVMELGRWRDGGYTERIEDWMELQKRMRIYELGSLPPFLLVFAGRIAAVEHRWNQHGLGGDNYRGLCRDLHPGPVSLLHWSGKGKPWARLDGGRPCPVDAIWAPYDLLLRTAFPIDDS